MIGDYPAFANCGLLYFVLQGSFSDYNKGNSYWYVGPLISYFIILCLCSGTLGFNIGTSEGFGRLYI